MAEEFLGYDNPGGNPFGNVQNTFDAANAAPDWESIFGGGNQPMSFEEWQDSLSADQTMGYYKEPMGGISSDTTKAWADYSQQMDYRNYLTDMPSTGDQTFFNALQADLFGTQEAQRLRNENMMNVATNIYGPEGTMAQSIDANLTAGLENVGETEEQLTGMLGDVDATEQEMLSHLDTAGDEQWDQYQATTEEFSARLGDLGEEISSNHKDVADWMMGISKKAGKIAEEQSSLLVSSIKSASDRRLETAERQIDLEYGDDPRMASQLKRNARGDAWQAESGQIGKVLMDSIKLRVGAAQGEAAMAQVAGNLEAAGVAAEGSLKTQGLMAVQAAAQGRLGFETEKEFKALDIIKWGADSRAAIKSSLAEIPLQRTNLITAAETLKQNNMNSFAQLALGQDFSWTSYSAVMAAYLQYTTTPGSAEGLQELDQFVNV